MDDQLKGQFVPSRYTGVWPRFEGELKGNPFEVNFYRYENAREIFFEQTAKGSKGTSFLEENDETVAIVSEAGDSFYLNFVDKKGKLGEPGLKYRAILDPLNDNYKKGMLTIKELVDNDLSLADLLKFERDGKGVVIKSDSNSDPITVGEVLLDIARKFRDRDSKSTQ